MSDKPTNLKDLEVTNNSVKLSWEFKFEEKLSPFQGFAVFFAEESSDNKMRFKKINIETTAKQVKVDGLKAHTVYFFYVASQHLVGLGFISDRIEIKTQEGSKIIKHFLYYDLIFLIWYT